MKKLLLILGSIAVTASAAAGAIQMKPADAAAASSARSGLRPFLLASYADNYNRKTAQPSHWQVGTAESSDAGSCASGAPVGGNEDCIGSFNAGGSGPSGECEFALGDTPIARVAYVGSFRTGVLDNEGNEIGSILAFDANQCGGGGSSGGKFDGDKFDGYRLIFHNAQNFTGQAYNIGASILSRGDGIDTGAQGVFVNRGPFGGGEPGAIQTVLSEASLRQLGVTRVPGRGTLVGHETGAGPPYLTFDRTYELELDAEQMRDAIAEAKASPANYTSCAGSCISALGVLTGNVECNIDVKNALYIGVTAVRRDGSASRHVQQGMLVDNIIHLMGDCDFDGGCSPGDVAWIELVCN